MDEYVDWDNGTTYFNSRAFIQLLEFVGNFPEDSESDAYTDNDEPETIISGRQILNADTYIGNLHWIQLLQSAFGGDIVFKGFPTEARNGNAVNINFALAISSNSSNKEGAWEFIRTTLMKDWQLVNFSDFPTNKAAFDERLENAKLPSDNKQIQWGNTLMDINALTQKETDQIMALISSINHVICYDEALMNIIMEGVQDYFVGLKTAEEAARIIQSRASIYVSEQSG
jgi:hypothetical protein